MTDDDKQALVPAGQDAGALVRQTPQSSALTEFEQKRHDERLSQARDKIQDNLLLLRDGLQEHYDLKYWVREHPWESLGLAFTLGLLFGLR